MISGNDTGNQVLTNKDGPIVLTTEIEGQQVMGLTISQNGSWYVSPQILSQVASQDVSQEVSQNVSKDVTQDVSQDVSQDLVKSLFCDIILITNYIYLKLKLSQNVNNKHLSCKLKFFH